MIKPKREVKERKIKAIVFDIGGVIIFYNHMIAARLMSKSIKIPTKKIFNILSDSGNHQGFTQLCEKGGAPKNYWKLFAKKLRIKEVSYKEFNRLWNKMFWPNKGIRKIILDLKNNYKLALISNINKEHKRYVIKKYNITVSFQPRIFSCDFGIRKPSPKIYQMVLKKLKLKPLEVVYIDDIKKNIQGAEKVGIRGILFKSNKQLIKDLKKLGVKIKAK